MMRIKNIQLNLVAVNAAVSKNINNLENTAPIVPRLNALPRQINGVNVLATVPHEALNSGDGLVRFAVESNANINFWGHN